MEISELRNLTSLRGWKQIVALTFAVAVSAALFFAVLSGTEGTRASAQTGDTPTPAPTATAEGGGSDVDVTPPEGKSNPPKFGNMDSLLNDLVEQVESGFATAHSAASSAPISDDESVAVALFLEADAVGDVQQYLEDIGVSPSNVHEEYIEAYVPLTLLGSLSNEQGVSAISAITPPRPMQVSAGGEGAIVHGAGAWHEAGLLGDGLKIGVIDVGFLEFEELIGNGLPSEGRVHAFCFSEIGSPTNELSHCASESRHGTGVTEAAYDIAPNATYYVANPYSWADLRATVEWMVSEGVDVINHSVGWTWSGPGDSTSHVPTSPLNTVDYAAENGILWVNAAGNGEGSTWFGPFNDSDGNDIHEFEDGDECNAVLLDNEEEFIVQLRWEGMWLDRRNIDLDIFLVDPETSEIVARADNFQRYYPFPYELLVFETEVKGIYCLEVRKFYGQDPGWIQLQAFSTQVIEYNKDGAYSITDPAASANPGVLAVGAAPWFDTSTIEPFSSLGPTIDGRLKPDIVGVDRVYSAAYDVGLPGTSQASPHVAGMAALIKQNLPSMGPVEVAEYLKGNALERGEPGPDYTWGHGLAVLPAADASAPEGVISAECHSELDPFENDSSGEVEYTGSWDGSCISEQDAEAPRTQGDFYSHYFTFEITADRPVTITLTSSDVNDTFLYVLEDWGTDGDVVDFNDDYEGGDRHSQIVFESLDAGRYTIEATTYSPETTGEFMITVTMKVADGYGSSGPPVDIGTPADGYIEVSYGANHACALHSSGSIYCLGDPEGGKTIPPKGKFESVSSGDHGSCAIGRDDGKLVCWGFFSFGE